MLADLDLLLTTVFATADGLLPWRRRNARRSVTDAEVVTLAVAQAVMDIASDREFLAVAARRLCHLIPKLPKQPGYWKRRARLADTIDWLTAMLRRTALAMSTMSCSSTPPRSNAAAPWKRRAGQRLRRRARITSAAATAAGFGACACTCWPPRTAPRARRSSPPPAKRNATSPCACSRSDCTAASLIVCDKGYAGRDFEAHVAERFGAQILRPARKDEHHHGPALSWIRQRIESIFWTLKDRLGLERHRARSLHGLRARIATKLLALAAGVWLNHYLGQPTRTFAQLAA